MVVNVSSDAMRRTISTGTVAAPVTANRNVDRS
jgi:hypothetical protein